MITGTLEYLRKPLVANVPRGSRVLVLTDTAHDPRVWQAVMTILADIGADATVTMFEPRPADYYDPPAPVCAAMRTTDLNVLLASTGMLHSAASGAAMEAGVPSLCMDGGMSLEMFQGGAVTADYTEVARLKHYVALNVFGRRAREVRVTSRFGTDVTYGVKDRIFVPVLPGPDFDGYRVYKRSDEGRGKHGLYGVVYPGGEFNVPPIEGSANGTIAIDLTMHHLGRLSSPILCTVREGRVVAIEGGVDARTLRDYLDEYGDENARCFPTEASVGVNRKARVTGVQREDKTIFGSMHFGLGTNIDVGGSIRSRIHMDGVVLEPTVYVDGEMRIKDGNFLVPLDRE